MSQELLKLENVGCRFRVRHGMFTYKQYETLRDISFSVKNGETLGILGKNGAGKSTLLKIIAGIFKPDTGKITYAPNISISLLNLQIGFDQELSGRTNILLSGMLLGFPKSVLLGKWIKLLSSQNWVNILTSQLKHIPQACGLDSVLA